MGQGNSHQPGGAAVAGGGAGPVVAPPAVPNPPQQLPPVVQQFYVPVRNYRPRRHTYNRAQKDRAVRLLNMGIPCRQVARMIGPLCSSGSPIRWRQQARRAAEARRRLEEMMRNRNGGRF